MKKIINKNIDFFKYIVTSFVSFLFDYFVYTLFSLFLKNIIYCNVFARIISDLFNYYLIKKYVFDYGETRKSLIKFYLISCLKLFIGTLILTFLSKYINHYIAKIISELLTFFISYFSSKYIIFNKNKEQ